MTAIFTVNYGGVYDFGTLQRYRTWDSLTPTGRCLRSPSLSAVQAYGAGLPGDFIQGIGSPSDSFHNIPIGLFWQDSWRVSPNVTLNFGVRYDVEIPPKFKAAARTGACPRTTCSDCKREFRPTRTISSRASAWRGIRRATARL